MRQFPDRMLARVQGDGKSSQPFPVTIGVKQGCVMAPTLFSKMFSGILTDAFCDSNIVIALGTGLMEVINFGHCKQKPRCRLMLCMTFSLQCLCTYCQHAVQYAGELESVLCSLQRLWPYNEHKEDWAHVPTCSCCTVHRAHCQCGW